MKIILAIIAIIVIGMFADWVRTAREEQRKKIAETPKTEKLITGTLEIAKKNISKITLHEYQQAFVMYKMNKGKNPPSLQALVDENYLPYDAQNDPFGQLYELQYKGREAILTSPGSDRVRGTPDDIIQKILLD